MNALAWDDNPEEYFTKLKPHLLRYGIHMEVTTTLDEFHRHLTEEKWDFIITDLLQTNSPSQGKQEWTGGEIASRLAPRYPLVFVITYYHNRFLDDGGSGPFSQFPSNVIVKSKHLNPAWMAQDIFQALKDHGLYVNRQKVFLIYGHNAQADGATRRVEYFLQERGVTVEQVTSESIREEIAGGLLDKMNDCAAFVALCTPDDEWKDSCRVPRQNVLLEMGIAMGLSRGLQRLVVLQKWGPTLGERATLPSDLGGYQALRFEDSVEATFEGLRTKLGALKVEMTDK